ncbi:hypothetical protein BD410DRAFT_809709 [Rickenella mellea]|uniref:HECT domain-containing protein n=1 Tax=Rickenella mellea TaxID=50990 RepID=A0A4Y7PH46_9AGAM|nr:hypothetical protein BD410DRAFT_809709 [Rickenella mellea]
MSSESSLPGRHQCTLCPCGGYTNANNDQASSPLTICRCSHPWITHVVQMIRDALNLHFRDQKGGHALTKCGGFFSYAQTWDYDTPCACSAPWFHHANIDTSSVSHTITPDLEPLRTSWAQAITSNRVQLPPPMAAFQGVQPTLGGNVHQRRMASSSQKTRGTSARTGVRANPYPQDARLQQQAQFVAPDTVECTVALLPYVLPGDDNEQAGHPSPAYRFNPAKLSELVQGNLRLCKLIIAVTLSKQGEVWAEMNRQIEFHCRTHGIHIPPCLETADSETELMFNKLSWQLIGPGRSLKDNTRIFKAPGPPGIDGVRFTYDVLVKEFGPKKVSNPLHSTNPLFLIVPRWGNLQAAIVPLVDPRLIEPFHSLIHACFASRVIHKYEYEETDLPVCLDGQCPINGVPAIATTVGSTPSQGLSTPLRPAATLPGGEGMEGNPGLPTNRRHRVESVSTPLQDVSAEPPTSRQRTGSAGNTQRSAPGLAPTNENASRNTTATVLAAIAPTTRPVVGPMVHMTTDEIKNWSLRALACVPRIPEDRYVEFRGSSDTDMAETLLDLLQFLCSDDRQAAFEPKVTCKIVEMAAFLQPIRRFKINQGYGNGPERRIYRAAAQRLSSDNVFWETRRPFVSLRFYPTSEPMSTRVTRLRAFGAFAALHMLHLCLGPLPISPFLILVAVKGNEGLPEDNAFIRALDPEAADMLEPWFALGEKGRVPRDNATNPICLLLIQALNMEPRLVNDDRSPEDHQAITRALLGSVLIGDANFMAHPDFLAFRHGFNIRLNDTRTLLDTFVPPSLACANSLIKAMYNRDISNASQVLYRVRFATTCRSSNRDYKLFLELFQHRFVRYVNGVGHPDHTFVRGSLITEDSFKDDICDGILRSRMLLLAVTDAELLPADPDWTLTLRLHPAKQSLNVEFRPEPTLHFHTCESACDIEINEWLQNALLENPASSESATLFDCWFHGQIMRTTAQYNDI